MFAYLETRWQAPFLIVEGSDITSFGVGVSSVPRSLADSHIPICVHLEHCAIVPQLIPLVKTNAAVIGWSTQVRVTNTSESGGGELLGDFLSRRRGSSARKSGNPGSSLGLRDRSPKGLRFVLYSPLI